MVGFVISHRNIWENDIFHGDALRVGVWHWMLHTAAWKDTTQVVGSEVVKVRRGELCVSQLQIMRATGMGRQSLRTFLNVLEKTGSIAPQPATRLTKGRTLITICKYEEYQGPQPRTNQAPTKGQPTKEQGNNETTRQEKEDTSASLPDLPPDIDEVAQAISAYNAAADRTGWPKVQKLTPARRTALRSRLTDAGGAIGWEHALEKAEASSFLTGRSDRPFTASFDFIAKSENFTKIMEGNYDDRNVHNQTGSPGGRVGGRAHDSLMAGFAQVANRN